MRVGDRPHQLLNLMSRHPDRRSAGIALRIEGAGVPAPPLGRSPARVPGDRTILPVVPSWRRRAFARATREAGLEHAGRNDLRHSFASLLLREGSGVIYVARQLGHDARLTLTRYGHVIDEIEDMPRLDAESAIVQARRMASSARCENPVSD
jgi:integrase